MRPERKQRCGGQQQPGHHAAEGGIGREQQQGCASRTADQRKPHQQSHRQPGWRSRVFAEAPGAGDVARQQRHRARGVGRHGWHAGEHERGQGQKAAPARNSIEGAGDEGGGEQQSGFQGMSSRPKPGKRPGIIRFILGGYFWRKHLDWFIKSIYCFDGI